jgi:CrcB protein
VAVRSEIRTITAVAVGGTIGAAARWSVWTQLEPDTVGAFPWSTLAINVLGCFLVGLAATRFRRGSLIWAFVATGILGGFTTMSGFAVELNDLAEAGRSGVMIAYLVATLGAGFVALNAAELISGPIDDTIQGTEGIE